MSENETIMSQITAREFDKLMWDFNRKIERLEKIHAVYKEALRFYAQDYKFKFIQDSWKAQNALAEGAAIAGSGVE